MDAGAAVVVWLLAAGESVGKRADAMYVGLYVGSYVDSFELSLEEEVGKYVGAPVRTVGASGDRVAVGGMVTPLGMKYTSSTNTTSVSAR